MPVRFQIKPRDVPAKMAALRMGRTEAQFHEDLPRLLARGFPKPDETTGNYDLDAIDEWCKRRHPELFLIAQEQARDARAVVNERLARMRHD